MANKLLTMQKLRQVLRLYAQGRGSKSMSNILSISRHTVKKDLQKFRDLDLNYESTLSITDLELSELFQAPLPHPSKWQKVLESLIPGYLKRLKGKGMTRFYTRNIKNPILMDMPVPLLINICIV